MGEVHGAVSAPGDVVAANLNDGSVARFDGRCDRCGFRIRL